MNTVMTPHWRTGWTVLRRTCRKYGRFARMAFTEKTGGGLIYLLPDFLLQAAYVIPLLFLWRVLLSSGAGADAASDMGLDQMLAYTCLSSLLSDLLVVHTPASSWLASGVMLKLYGRPASVIGQLAAQAAGSWGPKLLLFSLPAAVMILPLFGILLLPASVWFFPSLLLCVSLGFAVEVLFTCVCIHMRSMEWLVYSIRMAVTGLLSGTFIPIRLLPFGLDEILRWQPLASLGGAPLSVFTGMADPAGVLPIQLLWNAVLWPLALLAYRKSEEAMVSYGG